MNGLLGYSKVYDNYNQDLPKIVLVSISAPRVTWPMPGGLLFRGLLHNTAATLLCTSTAVPPSLEASRVLLQSRTRKGLASYPFGCCLPSLSRLGGRGVTAHGVKDLGPSVSVEAVATIKAACYAQYFPYTTTATTCYHNHHWHHYHQESLNHHRHCHCH